jgi:hypothetical protein
MVFIRVLEPRLLRIGAFWTQQVPDVSIPALYRASEETFIAMSTRSHGGGGKKLRGL